MDAVDASCPGCRAGYEVSSSEVPDGGRTVQCGKCRSS
ncbi:MAG: zinc-ribbon domain-containing protein [Myxococcaceae bacterium]|nr:zinc-ribbon domain-containing protein [Myxococcaceae bacterium]MCA3012770.1 zinc-ribbon domain-containing protein [Myxococcaceae bacterium]